MAEVSPRINRRFNEDIDKLLKQFQQEPILAKQRLVSLGRQHREPTSSKNIKPPPSITLTRRRMSTDTGHHSPEHTFLEEFCKQVSEQKKQINVIRKENLKENIKCQPKSASKPVMDIVDWIKMKAPTPDLGLGTIEFNRQHEALEKLINRNQQALQFLVKNRKELMEICMTKQLRKLC